MADFNADEGEKLYWELCPENGSSLSQEILKPDFFWQSSNDYAPLGSDTGSDTLGLYQSWRAYNFDAPTVRFVSELSARWEVGDCDWDISDVTHEALEGNHYQILTRDDMIIAVAFAEIIIDGRISDEIACRALAAIQRQESPTVLSFRGWESNDTRLQTLGLMRGAIEGALANAL